MQKSASPKSRIYVAEGVLKFTHHVAWTARHRGRQHHALADGSCMLFAVGGRVLHAAYRLYPEAGETVLMVADEAETLRLDPGLAVNKYCWYSRPPLGMSK